MHGAKSEMPGVICSHLSFRLELLFAAAATCNARLTEGTAREFVQMADRWLRVPGVPRAV